MMYDGKILNLLQSFQVCPQFTTYIARLIFHLQAALALIHILCNRNEVVIGCNTQLRRENQEQGWNNELS